MRIGKSRLNLTAGIRLSKNIFFGDGISGALEGRGVFGTSSQALAISPQLAQAAGTFGTTSAAQLPYLAQGANTFGADHSATASSFTGLLDEYPGAAAAYSVRLLSSTYSGALVRIRRANDNNEEDFYPDSNNELSLNSQTSGGTSLSSWISSENGFIVTWYDQSGNSNDATQATAADQPQVITSGALNTINSKASINNNNLNIAGLLNSTLTAASPSTVYSVQKIDSGVTNNQALYNFPTTTANTAFGMYYFGASVSKEYGYNTWSGDNYGYANASSDVESQFLNTASFINGNPTTSGVRLFVNSSEKTLSQLIGTSTSRTIANGFKTFRGGVVGGNQSMIGGFQEIIVYNNELTDRTGIETNINNFFSIY